MSAALGEPVSREVERVRACLGVRERPPARLRGLDALAAEARGAIERRLPRRARAMRDAERVLQREAQHAELTDAALDEAIGDLRALGRRGRLDAAATVDALAALREAAARELGLRAHREQVAGAAALLRWSVVEMATGEGKTLTAALAAAIAGWRGRGVHVVTANDYLAQRDAEEMAAVYRRAGGSCSAVTGAMSAGDRRRAYDADVTYATSRELAADFLRDRLRLAGARTPADASAAALVRGAGQTRGSAGGAPVMRGLHAAIVDEADFVLIDDAVTPLVLSSAGASEHDVELLRAARAVAQELRLGVHFTIDRAAARIELTGAGRIRADAAWPDGVRTRALPRELDDRLRNALLARHVYRRGVEYEVADGKVQIIDAATGRLLPDRTWQGGVQQAVELEVGAAISGATRTEASISFQRFFRLYPRLAGATGTARESAAELWRTYGLAVVRIPTHRPVRRRVLAERVSPDRERARRTIALEAQRQIDKGRPVLIGTSSVADSEAIATLTRHAGLSPSVLNAVRHAEEAAIVARAGAAGALTVATNMAGRGTDIRLDDAAREAGGLCVVRAERGVSARTDRQLIGRSARQGEPGVAARYASLDDEVARRFTPGLARFVRTMPIGRGVVGRAVLTLAQRRAEAEGRRARRSALKRDDWLDRTLAFGRSARPVDSGDGRGEHSGDGSGDAGR